MATKTPSNDILEPPPLRPGLKPSTTRHWTSLQDHADRLLAEMQPDGLSTPSGPEDRREGFSWGVPQEVDSRDGQHPRRPSAREPKGMARILTDPSNAAKNSLGISHTPSLPLGSLGERLSSVSSIEPFVTRMDTSLSSTSTIIANGARRAIPDIRMFDPGIDAEEEKPRKPITKAGYNLSWKLPPGLKKSPTAEEKATKHTQSANTQRQKSPVPKASKQTLKDRRKMDQADAMKLTLPLQPSEHPTQRKAALSDRLDLRSMAPPRSRSPKTPWIRDAPIFHSPPSMPKVSESAVSEPAGDVDRLQEGHGLLPGDNASSLTDFPKCPRDRTSKTLSRNQRNQSVSGPTGSLSTREPDGMASLLHISIVKPSEELDQVSAKRSRRWRFHGSGARTSGSTDIDSPTPETPNGSFPLSRLRLLKKPISTPPIIVTAFRSKKTRIFNFRKDPKIVNMAVPPPFNPPGLTRVDTPPIFDKTGEVKGKLADFFFDVQDNEPRPRKTPKRVEHGGIWDSDALLMSLDTDIAVSEDSSDEESPIGAVPSPTPTPGDNDFPKPNATNPSPLPGLSPYPNPAGGASPTSGNSASNPYFRVAVSDETPSATTPESEALTLEERAKLEWLTPEHLPSSPLCPLHARYRGSLKGFCVFHGKGESEGPVSRYGEGLDSPASDMLEVGGRRGKRRRLVSLSSP